MTFLTELDLFKQDDQGKFVMDGAKVGFVIDTKPYAGVLTISNQTVYINNNRVPTNVNCPDKKGMRYSWAVPKDQVSEYFIFDNKGYVDALADLDKKSAEYYCESEKFMANLDADSALIGREIIKESLKYKHDIAEQALRVAQKAIDDLTDEKGIKAECQTLKEKTEQRLEKVIESWKGAK